MVRKIDAFCHLMPQAYYDRFFDLASGVEAANLRKRMAGIPALVDMDLRFRQMDEFDDYQQLINMAAPPVDTLGSLAVAKEMARIANEAMAELVERHPDRFVGFMAAVPMSDPEAAVEELDHAINNLGAYGAQIYTHVDGAAMDAAHFDVFYEAMAQSGKLLQVHPCRSSAWSDYPAEQRSKYEIWWAFGWEYDLSAFMARIVFSGVLERFPELKLLIHHGGSMVPHFSGRVGEGWDQLGSRTPDDQKDDVTGYPLSRRPLDYFKMMYVDSAMFGARHALQCSLDFYGVDRVLFASDSPFDPEKGPGFIRSTISNIEDLPLTDEERAAIYHGNVARLVGLDL